jgi:hypothetical protein
VSWVVNQTPEPVAVQIQISRKELVCNAIGEADEAWALAGALSPAPDVHSVPERYLLGTTITLAPGASTELPVPFADCKAVRIWAGSNPTGVRVLARQGNTYALRRGDKPQSLELFGPRGRVAWVDTMTELPACVARPPLLTVRGTANAFTVREIVEEAIEHEACDRVTGTVPSQLELITLCERHAWPFAVGSQVSVRMLGAVQNEFRSPSPQARARLLVFQGWLRNLPAGETTQKLTVEPSGEACRLEHVGVVRKGGISVREADGSVSVVAPGKSFEARASEATRRFTVHDAYRVYVGDPKIVDIDFAELLVTDAP